MLVLSAHLYSYICLAVWNIVTLLISLICRVHHAKCWAGGSTSWNQECCEKHQSCQIRRWHHPYGRKQRRTNDPPDESERGEWKSWLKAQLSENEDHGIWSHYFMGNRWGNSGRLYFGGSKITADDDWIHEIKRLLLPGRKIMTNLDSILKSRDIILPTKVCLVKAMVFPIVMYGCESWTTRKTECRRIAAFELWCWRRLLRVP